MEIRRNLIQQYNDYISDATAFNWVKRFTNLAVKEAEKYKPSVGGIWVADETMIDIDGKNIWFWDIIDTKTRFLLASHMSYTRTSEDAKILMDKAVKKAGRFPRVIYTDKLRAYLEGIEHTFGGEIEHRRGSPFDVESHHNYIERFHGTIKSRTKVMRGLHTLKSARLFMDGWLVHYNFFRPHMSLRDMTPAMKAGIRIPFRNWKELIEQPYKVTARIPIEITCKPRRQAKKKVIRRKVTKQSKPTQILTSVRLK
jgi:transposase-like protein